jgi:hypothetical protein
MEEWKVVPGFSNYEVSSMGNIRSIERVTVMSNGRVVHLEGRNKTIRVHPKNGFLLTDLVDDKGKRRTVYPHKVVALAYITNPQPRKNKVVVHLDGNLKNNCIENLAWTSFSASIKKGFELGKRDNSQLWLKRRLKYGPKGGNTSNGRPDPLDYAQKKRIHYLRIEKGMTLKELSEKYNCSISHIHKTLQRFSVEQ